MRPQHITAENNTRPPASCVFSGCFNEAAAYHCGKLESADAGKVRTWCFNEAAAYHCGKRRRPAGRDQIRRAASMRPQHITAENPPVGGRQELLADASMRPQHITAENFAAWLKLDRQPTASMRPQHITAENSPSARPPRPSSVGFNEAAAYHCGKRGASCGLHPTA